LEIFPLIIAALVFGIVYWIYTWNNENMAAIDREILEGIENGTMQESKDYTVYTVRGNVYVVDKAKNVMRVTAKYL
jgi:hypothetical protein